MSEDKAPGTALNPAHARQVGEVSIQAGDGKTPHSALISLLSDLHDKVCNLVGDDAHQILVMSGEMGETFSNEVVRTFDLKVDSPNGEPSQFLLTEFYGMSVRYMEVDPKTSMFMYVDNRLVVIIDTKTLSCMELWDNAFIGIPQTKQ